MQQIHSPQIIFLYIFNHLSDCWVSEPLMFVTLHVNDMFTSEQVHATPEENLKGKQKIHKIVQHYCTIALQVNEIQ